VLRQGEGREVGVQNTGGKGGRISLRKIGSRVNLLLEGQGITPSLRETGTSNENYHKSGLAVDEEISKKKKKTRRAGGEKKTAWAGQLGWSRLLFGLHFVKSLSWRRKGKVGKEEGGFRKRGVRDLPAGSRKRGHRVIRFVHVAVSWGGEDRNGSKERKRC